MNKSKVQRKKYNVSPKDCNLMNNYTLQPYIGNKSIVAELGRGTGRKGLFLSLRNNLDLLNKSFIQKVKTQLAKIKQICAPLFC